MTSHPDGVPIAVAAQALGVSEKTIRRRIASKHLDAHKLYTSQGYEWRVMLPGQALSTQPVHPDDQSPPQAVQMVARVDKDRLRVVIAELQRTRERVAHLEALLPEYGPRDPGPPVTLTREIVPYEDDSNVEAQGNAPGGFWARVVAWWEDGR